MSSSALLTLPLTDAQRQLLLDYGFDAPRFFALKKELTEGRFPTERNQTHDPLTPPGPSDITPWPALGSAVRHAQQALGEQAIARGEVCVAVLNGGMATRFGGVVKGTVPVDGDATFLRLKLEHIHEVSPKVPVFLMNSFATQAATRAHLDAIKGPKSPTVHTVTQSISMRLTPAGELFMDVGGAPSFYAPGHGDLLRALRHDPHFEAFVRGGGKYVAISNVDNLAATLSPVVLGAHIAANKPVTVEVAPRQEQDSGGAPVRRNGHLEVLEGFRFPASFDASSLPVFNTNSFVISEAAIRDDYPLTWFRADKKVDGQPVVQFERLIGEITAYSEASYLQVPREGDECRFLPVKTPADLAGILPWVRAHLRGI